MKFSIEINVEDDKNDKVLVVSPSSEKEDICVGKVFDFVLTSGEKTQFMVQRKDEDGYLCMLVDCLPKLYQMNEKNTNKGGYASSDLRKKMNTEIIDLFPADMRERMVPVFENDLLRLATEKESFGTSEYGKDEPESTKQFEPMKSRRNRIAFRGKDEDWSWWWLANTVDGSAAYFANVYHYGYANCYDASGAFGVRPAFKIKNL